MARSETVERELPSRRVVVDGPREADADAVRRPGGQVEPEPRQRQRQSAAARLDVGFLQGPVLEKTERPPRRGDPAQRARLGRREEPPREVEPAAVAVQALRIDPELASPAHQTEGESLGMGQVEPEGRGGRGDLGPAVAVGAEPPPGRGHVAVPRQRDPHEGAGHEAGAAIPREAEPVRPRAFLAVQYRPIPRELRRIGEGAGSRRPQMRLSGGERHGRGEPGRRPRVLAAARTAVPERGDVRRHR